MIDAATGEAAEIVGRGLPVPPPGSLRPATTAVTGRARGRSMRRAGSAAGSRKP